MDSWPAWLPDASQIAFVRNDQVLLVSPLGGGERTVAESAGRVDWTPDGSALLVLQKDVSTRHQHFPGHSRRRRQAAADASE
jgi:hypothetical protein